VVLVTSRAVLHAPGEHIFELGPFEVPHPDGLTTARAMGNEAVQLFVERAQAANSEFGLTRDNAIATAELCRRLDGLPLAIELAAARVRLLPPRALLEHLPPGTSFLTDTSQRTTARQSTLWNTLNWSHALLRPAEKTLFRRLAVFSAGCSPEAMEAVCNATHELGPVASELAASLADKSLVTYTASGSDQLRVTQLETVREFAWHELESCGESGDIQSLHAHYFADLAERLSSRLRGQAQFQAFAQLERELPNIRAALHWASRTAGQFVLGLTFATNLNAFWEERGYWTEGRNWLERFLGKVDENAVDPALLARALTSAGNLANFQGFDSVARGHLTRGLSFWRRQRTPSAGLATCLRILARATSALGDLKTARALCEEALAIATELAAWAEVGLCANVLGAISRDQGDLIGAVDYFQRSLATFRQLGDLPGSALVLWNLGLVSESNGDLNQARSSFEEGLDLSRRAGDRKEMARCRFGLARVAAEQDAAVDAANLAHEALSGFREMGSHLEAAQVLSLLALMELRRNQSETARAHLQESLNLRHIEDPRGNLATALVTLATPTRAATAGQLEHAVQACVLHLAEVEERRGQVV
jgi:non-specific serine/threonine protein kinase